MRAQNRMTLDPIATYAAVLSTNGIGSVDDCFRVISHLLRVSRVTADP
jgi:hypothetical protein